MPFVNPALLWGLLLVSAPIIIHLLNKRRFEVHHWAAMDFLLGADVRNRRRVRLEDLLLLLLRIGVIAAAVFLVARPLVQGLGESGEAARSIVLDDSFSMEHRPEGQSALERAREAALLEVREAIASGARVSLRRGSRPAEELGKIEGPVRSQEPAEPDGSADPSAESASKAIAALQGLEASDGSLRLAEALEGVAREVETDKVREMHALFLLSDFRRGDWLDADGELRPGLRAAFDRLKQVGQDRVRLRLLNAGLPARENCAVTRVAVAEAQPVAGVPATIVVEVRNFGTQERRGLAGELEVGDPANPAHRIPLPTFPTVPAGSSASVEIEHVFPAAGEFPLSARVDEDRLSRDDRAYGVAVVRDALSVLLVDGDPGSTRLAGEAGFLGAALAPRGKLATGIRPEVVTQPVAPEALRGRDVVFLLNCPRFTAAEAQALRAFAEAGGGVVFFLGGRVEPDGYREAFGDAGLFPASLKAPLGAAPAAAGGDAGAAATTAAAAPAVDGMRIDFGELAHPAFKVYRGMRDSSLERLTIARYYDLQPLEGAQAVAAYADAARTPAIVERAIGAGRAVLFNLTADRDWSDWPTDPSYPVVLQEWVRYLSPRRGAARSLTAGEPIPLAVPIAAAASGSAAAPDDPFAGKDLAVVDPRGERQPVRAGAGAGTGAGAGAVTGTGANPLRWEKTDRAGLYRVEIDEGGGVSTAAPSPSARWFAVNRPERESDLTAAAEGELRRVLSATGIPFAFSGAEARRSEDDPGGDIWRWIALTAGTLLIVELAAAYWFGRQA